MQYSFSKNLETRFDLKTFRFTLNKNIDVINYFVEVKDEYGNRINFNMVKAANGQWLIEAEKLPDWVFELEVQLSDAIEDKE